MAKGQRILLVVDLQRQLKGKGYEECLSYIQEHRHEYDKVVATIFINRKNLNANFKKKLGYTGCTDASHEDIEFKADQIYMKYTYALPWGIFSKSDQVAVIGCETDGSILGTCFSLWDDGIDFKVLWSYVHTASKVKEKELRKLFKSRFGI